MFENFVKFVSNYPLLTFLLSHGLLIFCFSYFIKLIYLVIIYLYKFSKSSNVSSNVKKNNDSFVSGYITHMLINKFFK